MVNFLNYFYLIYGLSVIFSYMVLGALSVFALHKYFSKNLLVNYNEILNSEIVLPISIIAPAYNESATINENVRSLLSLHYTKFEVIIVNDGSKDNTLSKLIESYSLVKVHYAYEKSIDTEQVRGIYKSTSKSWDKLWVIDKGNGGKADALNAGLNLARNNLVLCIDVDCMLENDALVKMVKPFLEEGQRTVIASGGIIHVANSCKIEEGKIIKMEIPKNIFARIQVLEYLRAFLMSRMAWSKMDGLLIISGAFGLFRRDVVLEVGGYNTATVGEDMELIVRMRRRMIESKRPYQVTFIPDSLCWTECPESTKILIRQRVRWTKGNIETLWAHRKLLFNPKYKVLGLLSFPYWLLYEWLAPIVEFSGFLYLIYLYAIDSVYWYFYLSLSAFIFAFAVTFTTLTLFIEEITYNKYERKRDILKLVAASFLEPFVFHPLVIYAAIKGNFQKLFNKKTTWGDMARKGFATPPK